MPQNTVVWELEPQNNGTLMKLTHRGFSRNAEQAENHSIGWSVVLGWLQAYAERGETTENRMQEVLIKDEHDPCCRTPRAFRGVGVFGRKHGHGK